MEKPELSNIPQISMMSKKAYSIITLKEGTDHSLISPDNRLIFREAKKNIIFLEEVRADGSRIIDTAGKERILPIPFADLEIDYALNRSVDGFNFRIIGGMEPRQGGFFVTIQSDSKVNDLKDILQSVDSNQSRIGIPKFEISSVRLLEEVKDLYIYDVTFSTGQSAEYFENATLATPQ